MQHALTQRDAEGSQENLILACLAEHCPGQYQGSGLSTTPYLHPYSEQWGVCQSRRFRPGKSSADPALAHRSTKAVANAENALRRAAAGQLQHDAAQVHGRVVRAEHRPHLLHEA